MILLTSAGENNAEHQRRLDEYYQIRSLIFAEELEWIPKPKDGFDKDRFDDDDTLYLLSVHPEIGTLGGVRLRPTCVDTMLTQVFSGLFESPTLIPKSNQVWESSRFCFHKKSCPKPLPGQEDFLTRELLIAMLEVGRFLNLTHLATVVDLVMEQLLLKKHGWALQRLGEAKHTGTKLHPKRREIAVGGTLEINPILLTALKEKANITAPLISPKDLNMIQSPSVSIFMSSNT